MINLATQSSIKQVVDNNIYMLKLLFKASKWRLPLESLFHISKGIVQTLIYTVLFGSVVKALENGLSFNYIVVFVGLIAVITCIALLFQSWFQNVFLQYDNPRIQKYIINNVYSHAAKLDIQQYEDPKFYDKYIRTLEEAQNRCIALASTLADYVGTFTTVIFLISIIVWVDEITLLFVFLPIIPSVIIGRKKNKCDYELYMKNTKPNRKTQYVNRVVYLSDYAKDIRLSNIFNCLKRKYNKSMDEIIVNEKKYNKKILIYNIVIDVISDHFVYIGILTYITYKIVVSKTLMIGDYLIVQNAVMGMIWRINSLISTILKFEQFSLYIDNFRAFMDMQPSIEHNIQGKIPDRGKSVIKFQNVKFSYDQKNTVIDDINITINKGEKVAIVGHNGAGKSTFIKLLLNLYKPTKGIILYNNENIQNYNLAKYRDIFGTVFQDFCLYAFTIGENIATQSIKDSDVTDIKSALKKCDLLEYITQLPNGINTLLTKEFDKKGFVPSGGQSQKIAIARAIYKKSDVLILDEPSSALDPISESKINELMINNALDKTVIMISHRLLSTVKADKIYLFDKGKIIEQGTHDELMQIKGKYADMFNKQASRYNVG